jgi:diazepam-binding inhibitor (GABA receptor modulating acyl-CoA-binding protein)
MLDFKGKAKWEAWNKCKGKSQDQAKADYVAMVEKISGKKF